MNCKKCNELLEEGVLQCPACGEAVEPEDVTEVVSEPEETKESKKSGKWWKILLAVLGGAVLLCVLVGAVLYSLGIDVIGLLYKPNDLHCKDSYTISDEKAADYADQVIATVGDMELTNSQLQIYYWMTANDFLSYYGSYLNIDSTKPLEEQECSMEEGLSWQQFFLKNALESWHRYAAMNLLAKEADFVLAEELQQQIDSLPEQVSQWALTYGYESAEDMIKSDFGTLCSMDAYQSYMQTYYLGLQYLENKYEELSPTDAEIEEYYNQNEGVFSEQGIERDSGKYYDVRHILFEPAGGTQNADGTKTYTEQELQDCLADAEAILDLWKVGEATEESFAQLASQYSIDTGSSSNGGLYSQLTKDTNFVQEFKDWYLDESRKPGDTGIVQSVYGYHVMYFSGSVDMWYSAAKTQLISEMGDKLIADAKERMPIEVNYKKIAISDLLGEEVEETTVPEDTLPATT